jgi:hypothetical protein
MLDFDVEAFVAKLESLGVKLTAVPLADGRMRINRWRMPHAVDTIQIESLWASQIGENQGRIDRLAAHLAPASAMVAGHGSTPVRPIARTEEAVAKSRDRPATVAGSQPVRPPARTAEGDAKLKDRLAVTANGSQPVRPSARPGETDAKSKDRPEVTAASLPIRQAGRPNSIGSSASSVPARPSITARR